MRCNWRHAIKCGIIEESRVKCAQAALHQLFFITRQFMFLHYFPKIFLAVPFLLIASICQADKKQSLSDDEIAKAIIQESIANYSGACACPYSTMKNGRDCGKRSAYSQPGGKAPVCYREDVKEEDIRGWRR